MLIDIIELIAYVALPAALGALAWCLVLDRRLKAALARSTELEKLAAAGELGLAHLLLGMQVDVEAGQRLAADLIFAPQLQQGVVNSELQL